MRFRIKIAGRIILPVVGIFIVTVVAILAVTYSVASRIITERIYREGDALSARYADQIRVRLERVAEIPREMAKVFIAMKEAGDPDRKAVLAILRQTLDADPDLLGTWTVWEANAFDGLDAKFKNAPGHDATGRLATVYSRASGSIELDPSLGYDKEGDGDYYLVPRKTRQETLMEPYDRSYSGRKEDEKLITTFAVPIVIGGSLAGVAGVDLTITSLTDTMTAGFGWYRSDVRIGHEDAIGNSNT